MSHVDYKYFGEPKVMKIVLTHKLRGLYAGDTYNIVYEFNHFLSVWRYMAIMYTLYDVSGHISLKKRVFTVRKLCADGL